MISWRYIRGLNILVMNSKPKYTRNPAYWTNDGNIQTSELKKGRKQILAEVGEARQGVPGEWASHTKKTLYVNLILAKCVITKYLHVYDISKEVI